MMFHGSITAIITPFKNGAIDEKAFDNLIEWQIDQGTHGLVVCGTTGESPTLSDEEHARIVNRAVQVVKGRLPVIAGTGSNSTSKAMEMTRHAQLAGVDAALVVTPYYNKPTQEGLYAHYYAITQAASLPIIIYNIPGRCIVDMKTETIARVAKTCKNIVGVKEASGDIARVKAVLRQIGPEFIQLSGDDESALDFLKEGGHGCISVTSNIAPALCAEMQRAWQDGNPSLCGPINERLMPLHKGLFVETSPAPVKYALSAMGFCTDELRLPLLPASPSARRVVDEALAACGFSSPGNEKARAHG